MRKILWLGLVDKETKGKTQMFHPKKIYGYEHKTMKEIKQIVKILQRTVKESIFILKK